MMVRVGWNSEYARKKYDVELDESDLGRLLADAKLPPDTALTVREAHYLLYYSAEVLARETLAAFDPSLKDQLQGEARDLNAKRRAVFDAIRKRLEPPQEEEPE